MCFYEGFIQGNGTTVQRQTVNKNMGFTEKSVVVELKYNKRRLNLFNYKVVRRSHLKVINSYCRVRCRPLARSHLIAQNTSTSELLMRFTPETTLL